ncbi:hypothetical protein GGX14DRAFT_408393 [Mycena pura]|uniref:Uncharacterized protein n=1 Tax=Mycena pura TaxID=153505 RepID=A0AAD6Y1C5_9AGAR|nr:hypothetical protein GGX14DRAFT_408393 [Mycena pura]
MFRNGLATCDDLRGKDESLEAAQGEVPHSSSSIKDSTTPPRMRISKVDPDGTSPAVPDEMTDVTVVLLEPAERKIGDKYSPSKLSDHRGPYFAHDKAELVQRDYTDKDGKLIAPEELYATLTEGTLVLVVVSLATYVIKDQKTESGASLPDKKIYHVLVDRLKVLDRGDAQPWNPPVPEIPETRTYSPMTAAQSQGRRR